MTASLGAAQDEAFDALVPEVSGRLSEHLAEAADPLQQAMILRAYLATAAGALSVYIGPTLTCQTLTNIMAAVTPGAGRG